jgi:hypothetical protein
MVRGQAADRGLERHVHAALERLPRADGRAEGGDLEPVGQQPVIRGVGAGSARGAVRPAPGRVRHAALGGVQDRVLPALGDLDARGPVVVAEEEHLAFPADDQGTLGPHELLGDVVEVVGLDGGEGHRTALWVFEGHEDVLVDLTVLEAMNPGTNLNTPATFGRIREAREMRQVQLGLRLSF